MTQFEAAVTKLANYKPKPHGVTSYESADANIVQAALYKQGRGRVESKRGQRRLENEGRTARDLSDVEIRRRGVAPLVRKIVTPALLTLAVAAGGERVASDALRGTASFNEGINQRSGLYQRAHGAEAGQAQNQVAPVGAPGETAQQATVPGAVEAAQGQQPAGPAGPLGQEQAPK